MSIKRIYIEITNCCNLHCSFCVSHKRKSKFMNVEEFEYIIKQTKYITKYIYLHVQGEPLLHPQLDKILDICDKYNLSVQLVTNATLLANHLDIYEHPSLRKISLSLHAIDQTKLSVNEYFEPIKVLLDNINNVYVELRFWNKNNMPAKSQELFNLISSIYDLEETKRLDSYKLKDNVYIYFQEQFEWPTSAHNNDEQGYCYAANNMLAILADGTVSICCLDANGEINIGNIFYQSLDCILDSDTYHNIINNFNNNKCSEELCKKCTYRNRFKKGTN